MQAIQELPNAVCAHRWSGVPVAGVGAATADFARAWRCRPPGLAKARAAANRSVVRFVKPTFTNVPAGGDMNGFVNISRVNQYGGEKS